jgi:deoxyadenosine/deoxycytidine kinase
VSGIGKEHDGVEGPRYIAVEGPIGVGKTSLVTRLSRRLEAAVVFEVAEENPFLARFYEDMSRWAFQAQLFFLLSRYRQQQELISQNVFRGRVISDYLFSKDRIFANLNLGDQELALYEQIYPLLHARIPRPDVVVYLQASTDILMERIALRGRSFEKGLSRKYLQQLNDAYEYYFFHYRETPLLVIKTTRIDFVRNEADLDDLVMRIMGMRAGVEYYTPLASR